MDKYVILTRILTRFFTLQFLMALSLRICTYNVHGCNDTKCAYIQNVLDNHDIVMLQEHWLYDSQCHVFEDRFREVSAYCVSGMNENCLTGGRGYGGCAILWRSSLSCTVEPINLDNNRVCAIKVKLHDISFMLCCVYMPHVTPRMIEAILIFIIFWL